MTELSSQDPVEALAAIEDADPQWLIDQLEEEHRHDTDHYVTSNTLDIVHGSGAPEPAGPLRNAIGISGGMDIV